MVILTIMKGCGIVITSSPVRPGPESSFLNRKVSSFLQLIVSVSSMSWISTFSFHSLTKKDHYYSKINLIQTIENENHFIIPIGLIYRLLRNVQFLPPSSKVDMRREEVSRNLTLAFFKNVIIPFLIQYEQLFHNFHHNIP